MRARTRLRHQMETRPKLPMTVQQNHQMETRPNLPVTTQRNHPIVLLQMLDLLLRIRNLQVRPVCLKEIRTQNRDKKALLIYKESKSL